MRILALVLGVLIVGATVTPFALNARQEAATPCCPTPCAPDCGCARCECGCDCRGKGESCKSPSCRCIIAGRK